MRPKLFFARSAQEWLSSLPITLLLLAVVVFGTGELIHSQLLNMGSNIWPGYHELRQDPVAPNCNPNMDIDAEVQKRMAEQEVVEEDDFGLFDDEPLDPAVIRISLENSKKLCEEKFTKYEDSQGKITDSLRTFRSIEAGVASLSDISLHANRYIMLFMLLITAITSTFVRDHIALRPMRTRKDMQVSLVAQFIGNAMIFIAALRYRDVQLGSNIELTPIISTSIWAYIIGFGILSFVSLWQIIRIPHTEAEEGGSYARGLLSIPLYTFMALISGIFFFYESFSGDNTGTQAGIIIYLNKMMDLSGVFINLGLYVWVGMLLKQTRLASLVFDTFRPWKMPPEILAFFAIIVSALPTAYTGGSAIYVIAAGAVIYNELRRAGARRQLALATTAMSGSMGIVLRPCLMIVLIAALNKEVTTSGVGDIGYFDFDKIKDWGLYTAGFWLFFASAFLFLIISLIANRPKIQFAPVSEALPEMLRLFIPILPFAAVIAVVAIGYNWLLDAQLDEFSAPIILPAIMLVVLLCDQFFEKFTLSKNYSVSKGFEHGLRNATNETTAHIGALLMLMGMSICVGAIFEGDAGNGTSLQAGETLWTTMLMLVVILVGIGMFMDPMGAIILVTLTLAKFAYNAGVDPLHFWMVTLMAFELGYLTPPVALNHLMTRHVVGEEEFDLAAEEAKDQTFYQRHERILLPIIVMAITLILVAFVPLFFYA